MKKVLSCFLTAIMVLSTITFIPQNQSMTVNAEVSNVVQITPAFASFDKKAAKQGDIKVAITPVTASLNSITNGKATLVKGTDYIVTGNIVTLKSSYLSAQAGGNTTLTLNLNGGNTAELTINIYDSRFVRAVGTHFYEGDNLFYFGGANAYQLFTYGDGYNDSTTENIENNYMNKKQIDSLMDQMQADGVTVLRTMAFSHGDGAGGKWHAFEPAKGVFNEAEFMEFDYIMESAKKHGMKVIIALENYWYAYGGIDSVLQWEGLPVNKDDSTTQSHTDKTEFYKNANCKADYKALVEHLLNRTNHYTGTKYKDDPAIFSWELMNEPCYNNAPAGDTGTAFLDWINEMGKYVKGLDPNHMISSGSSNAMDVTHTSPYVDFCTAHPYPDEVWSNMTPAQTNDAVKSWINNAHNVLKKPFIIEEFNSHTNKDKYWPAVMNPIEDMDAAGFMFWNYNLNRDDNFTMLHGDSQITDLFTPLSNRMKAKSAAQNELDSSSAIFDRYSANQADIKVSSNFSAGNTLKSVTNGQTILVNGTDYTVSNNAIILKKSYLLKLPFGNNTITFNASNGKNPDLNVYVFDSSIFNSTININSADFDKNPVRRKDITVNITANGNTLLNVTNGAKTLVSGSDYIVSGTSCTIKKGYLSTLPASTANLSFNFNKGVSLNIIVNIKDTSDQQVIDNFEGYDGQNANLQPAYALVAAGSPVTLSLSSTNKCTGNYGLKFDYNLGKGYCGVSKKLNSLDGTGYNGISFYIVPDGSNNTLTVQFQEYSGEFWETTINITGTTPSTVFVPFSSFKVPSWYSGGDGVFDVKSLAEFNMYVGGKSGTGTIYVDDIKLASSIPVIKYGDVNCDNKVNVLDYLMMKRYIDGVITKFPSSNGIIAADVNGDGNIDQNDYLLLRNYLIHKIKHFPVE